MNKIFLLVSNYFNNYIGSFNRSKNKSKYGIGASFIIIFGVIFIFLFTSMAITTMETAMSGFNQPNISEIEKEAFLQMPLYVSIGMMGMFLMLLTVTKMTSSRRNTDDELLLALPVKKSQIIISKIIFNYVFDLSMVLSTLLPQFIVYYIYVPIKPDIFYFMRFGYLLLVFPLLSNAVGTLFGYLFNQLTKRFVKANAIRSIISVSFLVIFMIGYYALQFNMELSASSGFSITDIAVLKYLVNYILGKNVFLTFVIISLICFLPFLLCVVVSAISLGKNISLKNTKNKKLKFNKTNIVKTLLEQEIGKYFNSSVYVMNTLFGGIVLIILSLMFLVVGEGFLTSKFEVLVGTDGIIKNIFSNIPFIVIMIACMIISTISISASSISLEGKNIWILKCHPISYKKVFLSKILTNFIISFVCILISMLFFGIRFILDHGTYGLFYMFLYLIITSLFALLTSSIGLFVNLIFPKLEWQTEAEVIKQSFSSGISLLINMVSSVLVIIPIIIFILFIPLKFALFGTLISIIILLGLIIVSIALLFTIGKKLYNNI